MEIRHTCAITGAHTLTNKSILYTLAGEGKAALLLRFSSIDQIFMLQLAGNGVGVIHTLFFVKILLGCKGKSLGGHTVWKLSGKSHLFSTLARKVAKWELWAIFQTLCTGLFCTWDCDCVLNLWYILYTLTHEVATRARSYYKLANIMQMIDLITYCVWCCWLGY